MSENEGFLARWSRRKHGSRNASEDEARAEARGGDEARAIDVSSADAAEAPLAVAPASGSPAATAGGVGPTREDADRPLELPPVESLTPQSDFRPFMQAGVDAATRNAALARLFSDPHFSVMDGLDVYIDDYNQTEPIPPSMLAKLKQLHTIGLSDEEIERADREGEALPDEAPGEPVRIARADPGNENAGRADGRREDQEDEPQETRREDEGPGL